MGLSFELKRNGKELCSGGRRATRTRRAPRLARVRLQLPEHVFVTLAAIFDFVSTVKQSANIFRFQLFMGLVEEIFKGEDAFARSGKEGMDEIEDSRKILFDFGFRAERDGGRRVEAVFFEFTFEDAADVLPRNAFVFEIIVFSSIHAAILHLHLPNGFVDVAFVTIFFSSSSSSLPDADAVVVVTNGESGNAADAEDGGLGVWSNIDGGAVVAAAVAAETPADGNKEASHTAHSTISGASISTSNVSCHNVCSGTFEDGEMLMPCFLQNATCAHRTTIREVEIQFLVRSLFIRYRSSLIAFFYIVIAVVFYFLHLIAVVQTYRSLL